MDKEKDTYQVKDLFIASLLYATGKKLLNLQKDNKFYWFIFEDKNGCNQIVSSYWRNEVTVLAKKYADALRTLKDMIFAEKEKNRMNMEMENNYESTNKAR